MPVSTEFAAALLSFRYPSIFPLNPDYVAARSLRSLRSSNTIYEATWSIAKLHNNWNFQRRNLLDVLLLHIEQNMTDRTTTGRQPTYKLIQDGETYDNVSYYAWVHFKPIFSLGYHEIAFDRRFPSHLLQKNLIYTKLLTLEIFCAEYFHIFLFSLRKRWYNNSLVTTCEEK